MQENDRIALADVHVGHVGVQHRYVFPVRGILGRDHGGHLGAPQTRTVDISPSNSTLAKLYCRCFVVSIGKTSMLVSMRWSEKFGVQGDVALLYDFANS